MLPLLVLFIVYAAPGLFLALIGLVTVLALHEFFAMSYGRERWLERGLGMATGTGLLLLAASTRQLSLLPAALTATVLGFGTLFLLRPRELRTVGAELALLLLAMLYLPLLLCHLPLLRELSHGREWLFLVLLIVMAGDSMAYFVGISCGRHKLYPLISPAKSIEGALGGLGGSLAGALIARLTFFPVLTVADCLVLGLFLGVMGQVGDLFESMLKRSFGVKDSGTLFPGHGGLLDRLDSLLFAFPPAYYYALWRFPG